MTPNLTDTPEMAADRELLKDLDIRVRQAGLKINVQDLRAYSLRLFVAHLIDTGRITWQEAEGYCLRAQWQQLQHELRQYATTRHT